MLKLFEPIFFDNVIIVENKADKYFVGILPVENYELRNTQFAELKGYILVALNSETINPFLPKINLPET